MSADKLLLSFIIEPKEGKLETRTCVCVCVCTRSCLHVYRLTKLKVQRSVFCV